MSMSVCLSTDITRKPNGRTSPTVCACCLLWLRCDTLCTSGFVDDVKFSHNSPYGVILRQQNTTSMIAKIPTKFFLTIKTGFAVCKLSTGTKSAVYDFLVSKTMTRNHRVLPASQTFVIYSWNDLSRLYCPSAAQHFHQWRRLRRDRGTVPSKKLGGGQRRYYLPNLENVITN